jgi:hypothetical protein
MIVPVRTNGNRLTDSVLGDSPSNSTENATPRALPPLVRQQAPAHVWMSRPPANAQFSHDVSLKHTITFSVSMPA